MQHTFLCLFQNFVYTERMRYRITKFMCKSFILFWLKPLWCPLVACISSKSPLFMSLRNTLPSLSCGFTKHISFSDMWIYKAHFLLLFVASLSLILCSIATQLCSIFCGYVSLFSWLCNECTRDMLHSLQRISLTTSHQLPTLF